MSIHDPEIPSLFGALDSLSCEDGGPLSAHLLRTIALNANRMTSRGHLMLSLAWPMSGNQNRIPSSGLIAESGDFTFGGRIAGAVPYYWGRDVKPIHVRKKPGLRMGTAKITASIGGTDKIYFKVCTLATGRRGITVEATGDGSGDPQTFTVSDIPIDPGPDEEVSLWSRGSSLTLPSLGTVATYGYPNTGTFGSGDHRSLEPDKIIEFTTGHSGSNPIWNTTGNTYASSDHFVYLFNRQDGLIRTPVRVTRLTDYLDASGGGISVALHWDGRLSTREIEAVVDGGKFEIREGTASAGFELFGFAVAADGRTA